MSVCESSERSENLVPFTIVYGRTLALVIGANISIATVLVHFTLHGHLDALAQRVARVAGQARTLGLVLLRPTNGVHAAHAADAARTLAQAVHTSLVQGTIVVHPTAN